MGSADLPGRNARFRSIKANCADAVRRSEVLPFWKHGHVSATALSARAMKLEMKTTREKLFYFICSFIMFYVLFQSGAGLEQHVRSRVGPCIAKPSARPEGSFHHCPECRSFRSSRYTFQSRLYIFFELVREQPLRDVAVETANSHLWHNAFAPVVTLSPARTPKRRGPLKRLRRKGAAQIAAQPPSQLLCSGPCRLLGFGRESASFSKRLSGCRRRLTETCRQETGARQDRARHCAHSSPREQSLPDRMH